MSLGGTAWHRARLRRGCPGGGRWEGRGGRATSQTSSSTKRVGWVGRERARCGLRHVLTPAIDVARDGLVHWLTSKLQWHDTIAHGAGGDDGVHLAGARVSTHADVFRAEHFPTVRALGRKEVDLCAALPLAHLVIIVVNPNLHDDGKKNGKKRVCLCE